MTYERLFYDVVDDVAIVRLNDPATLNAMTDPLGADILHALHRA